MKSTSALAAAVASFGFVVSAIAADMPVKAPLAVVAPINWTGFYVGATAGYGWGIGRHSVPGLSTDTFNVDGGVFGGTLGFNWQASNLVLGIETDYSFSNMKGSTLGFGFGCGAITDSCVIKRKSFGTARARVGYAFNNFLPYVTGGVAYGKLFAGEGGAASLAGSDVMRTGWAAGAGVEYALSANWSVKAEYLYVDLGSYVFGTFVGTPFTAEDGRFQVIRAGLNYKLGGI